MTYLTPGTVNEVSARFVDKITLRLVCGSKILSCSALGKREKREQTSNLALCFFIMSERSFISLSPGTNTKTSPFGFCQISSRTSKTISFSLVSDFKRASTGRYLTSTGNIFPLTRIIGAPEKYSENLSTSIVAEVMINLRSCRLFKSVFK